MDALLLGVFAVFAIYVEGEFPVGRSPPRSNSVSADLSGLLAGEPCQDPTVLQSEVLWDGSLSLVCFIWYGWGDRGVPLRFYPPDAGTRLALS